MAVKVYEKMIEALKDKERRKERKIYTKG